MTTPTTLLQAQGLTKQFGDRHALNGVTFSVSRGECFGFLGPNGAGKTTTIKIILGLVEKSAGTLQIFDLQIPEQMRQIKPRVGVVPQNDNLDTDLTVEENLLVYASYFNLAHRAAKKRSNELLDFFALKNRRQDVITTLSGGQRRRLLLARALIHQPELLIMDEPTVGLDPQARQMIWERLRILKEQGTTMLLTSHYMDEVAKLSDRILVLDNGSIVVQGEPQQMIHDMVGLDVFEIRASKAELDTMQKAVQNCNAITERVADTLLIYTKKECEALDTLIRTASHWIRRPANLEDLFIQLTGRSLQES